MTKLTAATQDTQLTVQPIFTPTELILPEDTSFDDWTAIGQRLQWISKAIHWWVGDWIRFGEAKFGEKYAQAVEETPFSHGTLRNDVWVAAAFEKSRRNDRLTFRHHAVVAALPPAEQDEWLDAAEREGWSSRQLWAESRDLPEKLVPLYDGVGRLDWEGYQGNWIVHLPPGTKLEAKVGAIHIILKEEQR